MANGVPPAGSLTADERAVLEIVAQGKQASLARRAQIILKQAEGLELDAIAEQVDLSMPTVTHWLRAYEREGLGIFPEEVLSEAQAEAQVVLPQEPAPAHASEESLPSIADLCERYQIDIAHGRHVGRLAAELFAITDSLHGLDSRYQTVIFNAGLLHNIAYAGGRAKHHTRGRDILLENRVSDLDDVDRALIAVTTAFHRKVWKEGREDEEPGYAALPQELRPAALVLAALIRIADGLDYSQSQSTVVSSHRITPAGVSVSVAGPFVEIDAARANHKADLWHAIFDVPLTVDYNDHHITAVDGENSNPGGEESAPKSPGIQAGDLMSEAGRKVLRFHYERMLQHEPGTRAGIDIEALHDMRVATRRMRAALRIFGQYYEARLEHRLLRELRRTADALGRVRDLDVFMENAQRYLDSLPAESQHELDILLERWQAQREKARRRMLAYLDSDDYRVFVQDFGEFVSTPGLGSREPKGRWPRSSLVNQIVPREIYAHYEVVRAYEPELKHEDINTLHALRIDAKRLRYVLEFFREVLGGEVEGVISTVTRLQDHLGDLHDADVAQSLLQSFMKQHIKRTVKKNGEPRPEPSEVPELNGLAAYLEDRRREMARLQETFPTVWADIVSEETRRGLAAAVSVL